MAYIAASHTSQGKPASTPFADHEREYDTRENVSDHNSRLVSNTGSSALRFHRTDEHLSLYDYCNEILDRIDDLYANSEYDKDTISKLNEASEHIKHWKSSIHWIWTTNGPPGKTTEQTISWLLGMIEDHNVSLSDTIHMYMNDILDSLDEIQSLHVNPGDHKDLAALCSALTKDLDTATQCLGQQLVPIRAFAEVVKVPEDHTNLMQGMNVNEARVPSLYTDGGSSVRDSVSSGKLRSSTSYSEYSVGTRFSGASGGMQSVPRDSVPGKDYYSSCVSRRQRPRRTNKLPKYFCTVCNEPFVKKADWKRHEEVYQERPEEFDCDLCSAKYFLDKDFIVHHMQAHRCVPCSTTKSPKKHVQESRRQRTTRSGWGCGFCYHFTSNWTQRCNHIAFHVDTEGKTVADWNHSKVIYSLLHRPEIVKAWNTVLESKQRIFIGFGWDPEITGRVEGYPDSTQVLQLQDELEFFHPTQDAALLARKAFDLAVTKVDRDYSEVAPPVPPKDNRVQHKARLRDIAEETESWSEFVRSIVLDDVPPAADSALNDGTNS